MSKRLAFFLVLLLLIAPVACAPSENLNTVTLVADGKTRELATEALTVRDFLAEANVTLDQNDRVTPAEPTFIEDGLTVRVIRVETYTETEQREIPFDRRTVRDATIPAGETQLLEPGVTGIEELTYRVTLEDGVEVDRRMVRRVTRREPRTEVLLVGAQAQRDPVSISGTLAYIANHNAWIIRSTSLNQRRLTHEGDLDGRVFALSPDGSHLLFTRIPTETTQEEDEDEPPINTLWLLDAAAAADDPVRLDAESILWADWEPDCTIRPTGTSCRIAYTTGELAEGNPGWKANNDLWITRPRPSDGQLFARRRVVELTGGGAYSWWGAAYAWGPDEQRLAYARSDEVGVIRAYDGQRTVLSRFPPYRTYAPWAWTPTVSWSPDGAFLITTLHGPSPTGEAPEDSPVFDIWALSADGTLTVELASETGMWAAPRYAPQHDLIAFARARSPYASQSSGYDLYLIDRDGSNARRLFPPEEEIGLAYPEMAWGPAGDRLAVVYQDNLYLIQISDGAVYQLTDEGGVTAVLWRGA